MVYELIGKFIVAILVLSILFVLVTAMSILGDAIKNWFYDTKTGEVVGAALGIMLLILLIILVMVIL